MRGRENEPRRDDVANVYGALERARAIAPDMEITYMWRKDGWFAEGGTEEARKIVHATEPAMERIAGTLPRALRTSLLWSAERRRLVVHVDRYDRAVTVYGEAVAQLLHEIERHEDLERDGLGDRDPPLRTDAKEAFSEWRRQCREGRTDEDLARVWKRCAEGLSACGGGLEETGEVELRQIVAKQGGGA